MEFWRPDLRVAKTSAQIQFGRNINRLRVVAGFTQEQLAEKADISRGYLQQIEKGDRHPTVGIAAKLRFALGCTWDELMQGISGDPYQQQ